MSSAICSLSKPPLNKIASDIVSLCSISHRQDCSRTEHLTCHLKHVQYMCEIKYNSTDLAYCERSWKFGVKPYLPFNFCLLPVQAFFVSDLYFFDQPSAIQDGPSSKEFNTSPSDTDLSTIIAMPNYQSRGSDELGAKRPTNI